MGQGHQALRNPRDTDLLSAGSYHSDVRGSDWPGFFQWGIVIGILLYVSDFRCPVRSNSPVGAVRMACYTGPAIRHL